ncbi:hypothetical protein BWQ96_06277 [Gracilariopsis chorda]|uniref:Uncharacterized protein n=1 Tax=Gracilariopsis chorda TaxID=448386 RepID=A0A2V3IPI6_9FLOR|nr:hypothetical protein BWQ96_06277 [Gracilariopsis chorda]|eukprot:PXF43967.1 hypothetical protein BWQ96_06277 [Gracilariopsis chorda]
MSTGVNHLRSPEQRRSDHLTILTRRAPPPRTCGRFFKVPADNPVRIHAIDPFDSDADTDGPPSDSFAWRREHSRIRTSSSVNSLSSRIDTDCPPRRPRRPSTPTILPLSRDRAVSFYGAKSATAPAPTADDVLGAISPQRLKQLLGDDYALFCPSVNSKHAQQAQTPTHALAHSSSTNTLYVSEQTGLPVSLVSDGSFRAESDDEKDVEQLSRQLIARYNRSAPQSPSVPLFVEEIGRVPRVAVVDGKARRIRVRKPNAASFRAMPSHANSIIARCFGRCVNKHTDEEQRRAHMLGVNVLRKALQRVGRWSEQQHYRRPPPPAVPDNIDRVDNNKHHFLN